MKLRYAYLSIVLLAFLLRFWHVNFIPPSLNSDEVAIGYNAYSILKTGKDEYGNSFPNTFRSFDDYKMPVYVYMVTAAMQIFGKSDFAVRFPSAFLGTLTVIITYFLVGEILKNNSKRVQIQIFSSFLLAISPWHIGFSRSGYESNAALFFIVAGMFMFYKGLRNGLWLVGASLFFSLSIWTYLTPRVFVPLLLIGLLFIYSRAIWRQRKWVIVAVITGLFILAPVVKMTMSDEGKMRAFGVSAFANPDLAKKSAQRMAYDIKIGIPGGQLIANRRITYVQTFLRGYFSHFDLNFLFLDKAIEKYRAPDMGLMYLFELPLLVIGAYWLIRYWSDATSMLFWWVAAAPVAAAFTLQLPHPVRTLVFLPSLQIIAAVGATVLYDRWKKFRFPATLIVIISIIFFLHQYFIVMPVELGKDWYSGRREMAEKLFRLQNGYDEIYVSNSLDFPYIFYLYYAHIEPAAYLAQGGTVSGGFTEQKNHFKNIYFRSISSNLIDPTKKQLFVGVPGEEFKKSQIIDTVPYPDGPTAIVFFR